MQSSAQTVDEYIASLSEDRREIVSALREFVRKHLPKGYKEGMQYGMISYYIPLKDYPDTYNKQPLSYIAIASQKNYLSLYLMGIYSEAKENWLRESFAKAGKKLDMGKSCIRFKELDDLSLDAVAEAIGMLTPQAYIELYEKSRRK